MLLFRLLALLASILIANSIEVGDNCACPTEEFDEFTDRGSLKLLGISWSCNKVVHCEWIIAPNENKSLTLLVDTLEFSRYDAMEIVLFNRTQNSTFDFRTNEQKKQLNGTLQLDSPFYSKRTEVPAGFGVKLLLRRNISDIRQFSSYDFERRVKILFFRHGPENRTCPPPIIEALETKQRLSLPVDNANPVCFFVIEKKLSDDFVLLLDGAPHQDFKLRYSETDGSVRSYNNHSLLSSSNKVDFLLTKESTSTGKVNNTYVTYSVIKNPCKCERETLKVVDQLNLVSPGFGYTCPSLDCRKEVVASNATDDVHLIVTIHKMQVRDFNHIRFDNDRDSTSNGDFNDHFAPNETNRHWNAWSPKLTISYSGHGADAEYNITVTRVQLPPECAICGDGAKTTFATSGFLHLAVPAHCRVLTCRWTVTPQLSDILNWNKSPVEAWEVNVEYKLSANEYVIIRKRDYGNSSLDVMDQLGSSNPNAQAKQSYSKRLSSHGPFQIAYYRWNSTANDSELTVSWKESLHRYCNISSPLASPSKWNEVTSPNYPNKYYNDIDCNYTITAPNGAAGNATSTAILTPLQHQNEVFYYRQPQKKYHVLLNITDFETEAASDVLSIYDGATIEQKNLIARRSNVVRNLTEEIIRTSQSAAVLHFVTDENEVRKGFRILFKAEKSEGITESHDFTKTVHIKQTSTPSTTVSPSIMMTKGDSSSNGISLVSTFLNVVLGLMSIVLGAMYYREHKRNRSLESQGELSAEPIIHFVNLSYEPNN